MSRTVPVPKSVWRCAGRDHSRCGSSERIGRLGRRPARRLPAGAAVQAAVVFNEAGTAFVADMAGGVHAYAPDGRRIWHVRLEGGISATPVMPEDDRSLFVATHTGHVYGLEAASGAIRWRREIPSRSDPRVLSDLLYVARADLVVLSSWGGSFHAVEAATGQDRFRWDAGLSPEAAAASDRSGHIYCLRARAEAGVEFVRVDLQGEERVLFREPEDSRGARRALVAAAPVLDERLGVAYLVINQGRQGQVVAWSLTTGEALWCQRLPAAIQATPTVLPAGDVVVADLAGSVQSFSPAGTLRFRYPTGGEYLLAGGVGQADGRFWIGDPLGALHCVDPSGVGASFIQLPRSIQARLSFDPVDRLWVPCTDGMVYVFGG